MLKLPSHENFRFCTSVVAGAVLIYQVYKMRGKHAASKIAKKETKEKDNDHLAARFD